MKEQLRRQITLILDKYDKLGIQTDLYAQLKQLVNDEHWLSETASLFEGVENLDKTLNISKQITKDKNDQRVNEAFAEIDVARYLATTRFYGDFDKVTYQRAQKDKRWPDIVAEADDNLTPVEVKLLSPQGLNEDKFFQKLVDKLNKHAIPQLIDFHSQRQFDSGYVFVMTYHPIELQNIQYDELKKRIEEDVPKQEFEVVIICQLYGRGLWDFHIRPDRG